MYPATGMLSAKVCCECLRLRYPCSAIQPSSANIQPYTSRRLATAASAGRSRRSTATGGENDLNDCYFNSAVFGADYVTCNSQGTFPELSIALTGKETK